MKTGQKMKNMKLALLAGVAVIGSVGLGGSANAQTATPQGIYGGGSTLASKVYRQLFDCWGVPATGGLPTNALAPNFTFCQDGSGNANATGDTSALSVQILYSPVGSGAGKRAYAHHDGSNSTATGLGTPAASNQVAYTSSLLPAYGYPILHFAGSDDVITQTDVNLYNTNGGPANYGAILQIPAFSTTVTIPFNLQDTSGNAVTSLNLTRQAFCGIFSGHITQWSNPIITANNTATVSGPITVVHRSDGSGTTFLTSNALKAQCAGVVGPNNETDPTPALYEFNYTDHGVSTAQCNVAIPVEGADTINWPDLVNDQCGQPIAPRNPGGGTYVGASGSGGIVATVTSTPGAIGYVSPDFVSPVVPLVPVPPATTAGLPVASLQSQYDIDNSTGAFQSPTPAGAATAMSAANPTFDSNSILNPINWSRQGVVPNPLLPNAYPISGFTWLDFYQCYNQADLASIQTYLGYHYGNYGASPATGAEAILNGNGFAAIPQNWLNAVNTLYQTSGSALGNCGVFAGQ
jgi:phosphate transport system substrate-binding protein